MDTDTGTTSAVSAVTEADCLAMWNLFHWLTKKRFQGTSTGRWTVVPDTLLPCFDPTILGTRFFKKEERPCRADVLAGKTLVPVLQPLTPQELARFNYAFRLHKTLDEAFPHWDVGFGRKWFKRQEFECSVVACIICAIDRGDAKFSRDPTRMDDNGMGAVHGWIVVAVGVKYKGVYKDVVFTAPVNQEFSPEVLVDLPAMMQAAYSHHPDEAHKALLPVLEAYREATHAWRKCDPPLVALKFPFDQPAKRGRAGADRSDDRSRRAGTRAAAVGGAR